MRQRLEINGWTVVMLQMSQDPWDYRNYIRSSCAEFSVAKDMVVRTRLRLVQ